MATAAILTRKETYFVFWRPGCNAPPPNLVIGILNMGPPPTLGSSKTIAMVPSPLNGALGATDLWEINVAACGLTDGQIYHYWFEVQTATPYRMTARPGATSIWEKRSPGEAVFFALGV